MFLGLPACSFVSKPEHVLCMQQGTILYAGEAKDIFIKSGLIAFTDPQNNARIIIISGACQFMEHN
jgi:hypothetical protein